MKNLVVLPTLDGSKEAAIERLDAWLLQRWRQEALTETGYRVYDRLGDVQDRRAVLGAAS